MQSSIDFIQTFIGIEYHCVLINWRLWYGVAIFSSGIRIVKSDLNHRDFRESSDAANTADMFTESFGKE